MNRRAFALIVGASCAATLGSHRIARAESPKACLDAAERGQVLRDQAKLLEARDLFRVCAAEGCPDVVRRDCGNWLADIEKRIPTVTLTATDPAGNQLVDVRVLIDGAPYAAKLDGVSHPVNPGVHTFRFEPPNGAPVEKQLLIRDGEKYQQLNVVLEPGAVPPLASSTPPPAQPPKEEPPPSSSSGGNAGFRTAAIISAGVGVVAIGSFAFFGITGTNDVHSLENSCGHDCMQDDVDAAKRKLLVADVSLGVGVVAAALAAFFYIESRPHDAPASSGISNPTLVRF